MNEERLRDYLLGRLNPQEHQEVELMIASDQSIRSQADEMVYLIHINKALMKKRIQGELIELEKKALRKRYKLIAILLLILLIVILLIYYILSQPTSPNRKSELHTTENPKNFSAIPTDTINKNHPKEPPKELTARPLIKQQINTGSSFPLSEPILTQERIKLKTNDQQDVADGEWVSIRLIKTKDVNPQYQFERDEILKGYRLGIKG
jgi:hypothetical protein